MDLERGRGRRRGERRLAGMLAVGPWQWLDRLSVTVQGSKRERGDGRRERERGRGDICLGPAGGFEL